MARHIQPPALLNVTFKKRIRVMHSIVAHPVWFVEKVSNLFEYWRSIWEKLIKFTKLIMKNCMTKIYRIKETQISCWLEFQFLILKQVFANFKGPKNLLNLHIADSIRISGNQCLICGKAFATPGSAKRHFQMAHTDDWHCNQPCTVCGKSFKNVQTLKNHLRKIHQVYQNSSSLPKTV